MRYVFSRRGLWVINTPYRRILREPTIGAPLLECATQWLPAALPAAHERGVFAGAAIDRIPPGCAVRRRILSPPAGAAHCDAGDSVIGLPTMESMAKTVTATM